MKRHTQQSALVTAGMLLLSTGLFAQSSDSAQIIKPRLFSGENGYRTWSIGVHGGVLAPSLLIGGKNDFSKSEATIGYGVYVKKQVLHNLGFQAEFLKGTLKGNNDRALSNGQPVQSPYSSFKTTLNWAASISGVYNIANINWLYNKSVITPYITAGAGLVNYNPKLTPTGSTNMIDYKPNGHIQELFIPVGAGVKFGVATGVNIDLGYRMNFVDADNLDGYYKGGNDKFSYGHIGIEFALGNKRKQQLAMHNPAAQLASDLRMENEILRAAVAKQQQKTDEQSAQLNAMNDDLAKMKRDSDGDGVSDYFDKCPDTQKGVKVDGSGCPLPESKTTTIIKEVKPVVTEEDRKVVSEAIHNLEFDFGKSTIRSSSFPTLDRVGEMLVNKGFNLKLSGHTDNIGSKEKNLSLSRERAEAVKNYLVSKGANASKIEAIGFGSSQPIASNKTDEGRQQNRRVEFNIF